MMKELIETRFFALLAGESLAGNMRAELEEESGKFSEAVAEVCDMGEDYLSTCRTLNYTKNRLQALRETCRVGDGPGEKRVVPVMFYREGTASG